MKKLQGLILILLITAGGSTYAQNNVVSDAVEFGVLKDLFDSLNGPAWTTKTNWPTAGSWPSGATNAQFGTWFGVTVTNGDITQIAFLANNMTGRLPASVGLLSKLQRLNIQSNHINGTLPATVGNLSQLQWLWFPNNQLTGAVPDEIGNLTAMTSLNLVGNQLSGRIPATIGGCTSLQIMQLSANSLSGSIPASIGNLHNVQQVFLETNGLSGPIPDVFASMAELRDLRLSNNQLSGSLPPSLGRQNAKLTRFLATNNKLTGQIPSTYGNLTLLNYFYVDHNQLTGEFPSFVGNWTSLFTLNILNNRFSGQFPSSIGNCTSLSVLLINRNRFTGDFPSSISTTLVNSLDASDNYFTSIPSSITSRSLLTLLFQNNDLASVPNFGTYAGRTNLVLNISNNRLDFSQLERHVGTGIKSLTQTPQKTVRDQTTQVMTTGAQLVLTARPVGTYTSLTWKKRDANGSSWTTVTDSDGVAGTFTISSAAETDAGAYKWSTTSSLTSLTNLTIESEPITVKRAITFALDNWSFQYRYDGRKRMTHKRVPGAEWTYMVYDDRDRLVMTQDGEQRKTNRWTVTKYDVLNRPIITGIYTRANHKTQEQMSGMLSTTQFYETWTGTGKTKYTSANFPASGDSLDILTVTYYDNYSFATGETSLAYKSDQLSGQYKYNGDHTSFPFVTGMATGGMTRVLDPRGYVYFLKSAIYYDNKSRVVQTVSQNHDAGTDRVSSNYDFTGKVTATRTTHVVNNVAWKNMAFFNVSGNVVSRASGNNAAFGPSGASSVQGVPTTGGWVEATVTETNSQRYFGLASTDPAEKLPASMEFAFQLNGASLLIYESGVYKYTVPGGEVTGDRLKIERTGNTINYYRNNVSVYGTTIPVNLQNSTFYLDVALSHNSTILGPTISTGLQTQTTLKEFDYDHAGRLQTVHHTVNAGATVLLLSNEYNEIGQLVDKKLFEREDDDFSQSIDYRYNIRGWLTSVNGAKVEEDPTGENDGDDGAKSDLFGMNLLYNTTAAGMSNSEMFNGNISAMQWRTNLGLDTIGMRGYIFGYDPMNRLKNANQKKYDIYTSAWSSDNSFTEGTLTYDLNGNISGLQRTGAGGAATDNLTYTYGSAEKAGNRLLKVADAAYSDQGFKDVNTSADDYVYDSNGNMTNDGNKGIGINYNLLNLPAYVQNTPGESIIYLYDAAGRKLSQIVRNASGIQTKQTDYHGEYIYENDTLKFSNHEEGRIIMTGPEPEYQYHLKDHLGNVRMTFTTKDETDSARATLEDDHSAEDESNFINYDNARRVYSQLFDKTNGNSPGYAQRLSGSDDGRIGLARSFSVMPGDVVRAEVYAKYVDPENTNWSAALEMLLDYIGTPSNAPPGIVVDGSAYANSSGPMLGIAPIDHVNDNEGTVPKAYLNYIFINRNYDIASLKPLATRITEVGKEDGSDGAHSHLTLVDTISEPGYVYVYLSNDGEEVREVYFDDFRVEHIKSPVIQSEDFYPYGLSFNSYQRENSLRNQYLYNKGAERQDELDLNVDFTKFRMYDPAMGRWWQLDPLATEDALASFTPYNYSFNNPIRYNDPEGDCPPGENCGPLSSLVNGAVELWNHFTSGEVSTQAKMNTAAEVLLPVDLINVAAAQLTGEEVSREQVIGAVKDVIGIAAAVLTGGESKVATKSKVVVSESRTAPSVKKTDYSHIKDPSNLVNTKPTPRQVREMKAANRANNNGELRDDVTGERMVESKKSQRGVTPPSNEAQVDHIIPVSKGGTRAMSNLELRTRKNNRDKSDN